MKNVVKQMMNRISATTNTNRSHSDTIRISSLNTYFEVNNTITTEIQYIPALITIDKNKKLTDLDNTSLI